ncbi:hypothetical protein KDH_60060 [Dictyobacter sp. S3.2.2.5]|uniref:Probable membrane transporter protein n=2 Tax=Dictyobacter halimunensis TaxID=3026934 RepID=A0ABQ6G1Q5_9CHLR|nr:hypothetical protein KDH_60060 [Dictyobacter sp. S3.2.2.5]
MIERDEEAGAKPYALNTPVPSISNKAEPPQQPDEKGAQELLQLSNSISWILQGGVILSALLIVLGIAMLPTRPGGLSASRLLNFPQTLGQVGAGLLILRPQAFIMLGLLLLIATPIVRVAASLVMFIKERDYTYVVITAVVLAILIFSLFIGNQNRQNELTVDAMQLHFSLGVALLIFAGSLLAGIVGALVGLGGGIMVVPMLTIVFGFPIPFAIGVSIISVIATSSGAAVAYVRDRLTNIRIGMFLEIGTTLGAISGAFLAGLLAPNLLGVIFGFILLVSAAPLIFKIGEELPRGVINDRWARTLKLASSYPDRKLGREVSYQVTRTPFGLGMMYIAGLISGLLGIGSGTFKVIAMDTIMRLPLKVSTTTSNLMIGVTAAASAGIYFSRGNIPPLIAAPVALGVLMGALVGARLLLRMSNKILRIIFVPVILIAALEMILHGLGIGSF